MHLDKTRRADLSREVYERALATARRTYSPTVMAPASRKRLAPIRIGPTLIAVLAAAVLSSCGFLPISKMSFAGTELLEAAPKPPPRDSAFDGCGDAGSQPDYALNRLKNRVDEGTYLPVSWKLIARLPWPRRVGYRFRHQWTEGETRQVKRFEGAAVEVEGYVVAHKLEIPEPPNCYSRAGELRDFHLWLAEREHDVAANSIVVEITPRIRVSHPEWDEERLRALVATQARVRIRGWLMLDQMHPENVGRNRATLWEGHPIMHIDWRSSRGKWIPLDSLSPSVDSGLVQGHARQRKTAMALATADERAAVSPAKPDAHRPRLPDTAWGESVTPDRSGVE